ncbi:hypothetical protein BDW59DRAFT_141162 [Aspergillus cavernicola]|uniref:Uncharacterized protein n=1 Tax=Aspergillus cavernicola TaxID=176166 RepID=A0ABR4IS52_9EURO
MKRMRRYRRFLELPQAFICSFGSSVSEIPPSQLTMPSNMDKATMGGNSQATEATSSQNHRKAELISGNEPLTPAELGNSGHGGPQGYCS